MIYAYLKAGENHGCMLSCLGMQTAMLWEDYFFCTSGWMKSMKHKPAKAVPYRFSIVIPSVMKFSSPR